MSPISKEPLELDLDEPSSPRLEPKPSHHSAIKPTSPPGLDRSALFDISDDSAEDQVDRSGTATQHEERVSIISKDLWLNLVPLKITNKGSQRLSTADPSTPSPRPPSPTELLQKKNNPITLYTPITLTICQSIPSEQTIPRCLPIFLFTAAQ